MRIIGRRPFRDWMYGKKTVVWKDRRERKGQTLPNIEGEEGKGQQGGHQKERDGGEKGRESTDVERLKHAHDHRHHRGAKEQKRKRPQKRGDRSMSALLFLFIPKMPRFLYIQNTYLRMYTHPSPSPAVRLSRAAQCTQRGGTCGGMYGVGGVKNNNHHQQAR